MKHLRFLALIPLAACHLIAAEPAWKNELTPPVSNPWPALPPCKIDFRVSWNGLLDAGHLSMEFAPADVVKPHAFVVRSSAASMGPAAVLFPYKHYFWSELDPTSRLPKTFHAIETTNREQVTTTVKHFTDRVEATEITKALHKKSAPGRDEHVFHHHPVFDIFSAMLQVRSRKLDTNDRINLVIQPFDKPYLLNVTVLGREMHHERKTIKLSVAMRKIDPKTLELRPYKKMKRPATLWLSDDADRIPVELRAAIFIGDVRAVMTDFRK